MATGDLTTLANVKQWINIASISDDTLISRLITSVSNFIGAWLNRNLTSASYSEAYDGGGSTRLMLINYPVTAVASLVIDNIVVPASTDPLVSGYVFDQWGIQLRGSNTFQSGKENVLVTYTGGYIQLPVEIEQACIELVSLRYAERRRPGISSQSIGGENVTYRDVALTDSISTLLLQYKRFTPL